MAQSPRLGPRRRSSRGRACCPGSRRSSSGTPRLAAVRAAGRGTRAARTRATGRRRGRGRRDRVVVRRGRDPASRLGRPYARCRSSSTRASWSSSSGRRQRQVQSCCGASTACSYPAGRCRRPGHPDPSPTRPRGRRRVRNQDPLASFVTDTVEDELAYGTSSAPTRPRRRGGDARPSKPADSRPDPGVLSGGQQQRGGHRAVLAAGPRIPPRRAHIGVDPVAAEASWARHRLVYDLGVTVLLPSTA